MSSNGDLTADKPTWNMGLGEYKWIANAGFAGLVAVLFAGLIVWGAHTTVNQAVEAHKATNDLYLKIADQAREREQNQREDAKRIWQAISENTRINQETAKLNEKTQQLMAETSQATKELTEEVRQLKIKVNAKEKENK